MNGEACQVSDHPPTHIAVHCQWAWDHYHSGPMIIKADQKMPTFITQKIPIATTITIIPPSAQPGWTFGIQEMRLLNGPTFCLRLTISQKSNLTH